MDGASKHADKMEASFRNNGIHRIQCDSAKTLKKAIKTDCSRMIVLIEERFSKLLEDEYRICKAAFKDLVEAGKYVQLISYLDDDETQQEVKYKLPKAMRKNIVHHTRFTNSTNGYVVPEDHPTTAAQVGNNNHIEVMPGADSMHATVGRNKPFSASSGPSIQGYTLTITTPEADYELCTEIKKHIDSNIDDINISLKALNTARVESTSLGSVIIKCHGEAWNKTWTSLAEGCSSLRSCLK
ncbi:uncharacterized protein LOC124277572 isoform X2 [Haliotis rubra]|nr:uncharacterized protein LOC124277572 isoform X2 [Haliotis rubra]